MENWKGEIVRRLKDRDRSQRDCFVSLIASFHENHAKRIRQDEELCSLREKHSRLASEKERLEIDLSGLLKDHIAFDSAAGGNSGPMLLREKITELESKLQELKDERSQLSHKNGEQASRIIDLMDRAAVSANELKAKSLEIQIARETYEKMHEKFQEISEECIRREETVKVLKGELKSLKDDFVALQNKNHSLTEENKVLIDRWLRRMNEEAQKMNIANEFYNSYVVGLIFCSMDLLTRFLE